MPEREPLLVRILAEAIVYGREQRGDPIAVVERWLRESDTGRRFRGYVVDEAGLLWMAANRLNATRDEDLRSMGRELSNSAVRLWNLGGAPPEERS
jgi:hypothetical protein